MGGAWKIFRWALRNWYDEMIFFVATGLVSYIFQLPFAAIAYIAVGLPADLFFVLVTLITPLIPSPALVGLYASARELAKGEAVSWSLFWSSLRRYVWKALALFFLTTVGTLVLFVAVAFYFSDPNPILKGVGYILFYVLLIWLTMQLFLLPLLLEQERWNPLRLYRNAFAVLVWKPLLGLGLLFVTLFVIVVSGLTVIGMPILGLPMIAVFAGHALHYALYGPPEKPQP